MIESSNPIPLSRFSFLCLPKRSFSCYSNASSYLLLFPYPSIRFLSFLSRPTVRSNDLRHECEKFRSSHSFAAKRSTKPTGNYWSEPHVPLRRANTRHSKERKKRSIGYCYWPIDSGQSRTSLVLLRLTLFRKTSPAQAALH